MTEEPKNYNYVPSRFSTPGATYPQQNTLSVDKFVSELPTGLKLEIARKKAGLKQKTLADRIGVCRTVISRYENDVPIPEPTKIALASVLPMPNGWLD